RRASVVLTVSIRRHLHPAREDTILVTYGSPDRPARAVLVSGVRVPGPMGPHSDPPGARSMSSTARGCPIFFAHPIATPGSSRQCGPASPSTGGQAHTGGEDNKG